MQYLASSAGAVTAGGTLSSADQWAGAIACFKAATPLALSGSAAGNYTLTGGSVTVSQKPLTVMRPTTKTYDGTANSSIAANIQQWFSNGRRHGGI